MKKRTITLVFGIAVLALFLAACGSKPEPVAAPAKALNGVPDFVNDAFLQASEDVLIGIGSYTVGSDPSRISTGRPFAETRARADISRQLKTIVENMITDYTAQSELDPKAALSFQENINRSLSQAELRGSKTIKMGTENGILWVVMEYSKSLAANDYSAAQAAAKLAVPAAAAFDALSRMDNAFDKLAGGGPKPVGD